MLEITRRNPARANQISGWGVINHGLAPYCDSEENLHAPIHLFMSPPYSFQNVDPTKFNVGITMGERDDLSSYAFPFVDLCNQMDLLIVPGDWQHLVFQRNGVVKPVIETMLLGHDHEFWKGPVRPGNNTSLMILERGREHGGASIEACHYFSDVNLMDCRIPQRKKALKSGMTEQEFDALIENGRFTREEIRDAYHDADVFFKWSREGWCYPILEAMSAGCLVVTNCHTLPYLKHADNCLIFRTIEEMAQTLRYAASHHCDDIKARGQQLAASLTWEKAGARLRELIFKHYKPKT